MSAETIDFSLVPAPVRGWLHAVLNPPKPPPKRILMIEDDSGICSVFAYAASGFDVDITFAPDGVIGLEKIKQGGWNLVVLDLNLPRKSGYEVLSDMDQFDNHTPVIVISGELDITDAVNRITKIRFAPYLKKPDHFKKEYIESLLRHHQFIEKEKP